MTEEWRDIAGWEGFYQVSNCGRVRSLERTIPVVREGYRWRRIQERVLVQQALPKLGHRIVTLQRAGIIQTLLVHRLVLTAFRGPCPIGMQCCHFPERDPGNNRVDNLRWGTHADNVADRRAHGVQWTRRSPTPEANAKRSASLKRAWAERKRQEAL